MNCRECVWRLPKGIHPLLASPLYCRFAFAEGDLAAEPSAAADDIKRSEEIMKNAQDDMEALRSPNCAGRSNGSISINDNTK
jgi:hypothetical protein